MNTQKHKKEISNKLEKFTQNQQWHEAVELLENELLTHQTDHWLLTQLGEVYYEAKNYNKALEFTQLAIDYAPHCFLAQNNYAVALYINERYEDAIKIFVNMVNQSPNELVEQDCNEGLQNTLSIINDCRFRLGDCYLALQNQKIALDYYQLHLQNRKKGLFSNFTKKEVLQEIKALEQEIVK